MQLLLLPGNSPVNKAWIIECAQRFAPLFTYTTLLQYAHWETNPEGIADINKEAQNAHAVLIEKDYVIFAKSLGILVALQGIHQGLLKPRACVFVGLPLKFVEEQKLPLDTLLKGYGIHTTLIQHDQDPSGSAQSLKAYLIKKKCSTITLDIIPGTTHHYTEYAQMKKALKNIASS
ncbi:hypothetical protein EXS73_00780 [Candidatus Pacearchaeota archaeon]|nr:hypothetical protein [Candidatus Pacearchaeota archaeon]